MTIACHKQLYLQNIFRNFKFRYKFKNIFRNFLKFLYFLKTKILDCPSNNITLNSVFKWESKAGAVVRGPGLLTPRACPRAGYTCAVVYHIREWEVWNGDSKGREGRLTVVLHLRD